MAEKRRVHPAEVTASLVEWKETMKTGSKRTLEPVIRAKSQSHPRARVTVPEYVSTCRGLFREKEVKMGGITSIRPKGRSFFI